MTFKRMLIMLGACLIVFGGIFGMKFMGSKAMNDYFDNMPTPAVTILSATVERMQWSRDVPSVGSLVAVNGTDITSQAGGIVDTIHFTAGSQVKAGDLLVSLETSTEKAELAQLKAQADIAEVNLRRARDLIKRKVMSQSEFDQTKAEAAAARAAADAQQARLDQKEVRAPFAGVLGIRQISVGEYLAAGAPMVSLQSLDPMEIEFALPEARLSMVDVGLPISVSVDAWPGESFSGQISVIEPRIDNATRNFRARGSVSNPEGKLRAGMFGRITIQRPGTDSVLAIPRTSISYDSFGTSVFVIQKAEDDAEKQVVNQRFIRIGKARGDFVEVLEGLEEGEQIASGGLLKLRNGAPVIIDNSVPTEPSLNPDVADT
ncbi:MAG: efflux RND transporter periplasmic adaptor subunit [Oceanococcus sp.]|nr:MAG: efflux RND transporter periplasmic adaptor subunit [Oceanococcus sp.]